MGISGRTFISRFRTPAVAHRSKTYTCPSRHEQEYCDETSAAKVNKAIGPSTNYIGTIVGGSLAQPNNCPSQRGLRFRRRAAPSSCFTLMRLANVSPILGIKHLRCTTRSHARLWNIAKRSGRKFEMGAPPRHPPEKDARFADQNLQGGLRRKGSGVFMLFYLATKDSRPLFRLPFCPSFVLLRARRFEPAAANVHPSEDQGMEPPMNADDAGHSDPVSLCVKAGGFAAYSVKGY